jgi:putative hydrolase of the HAD superfamily
VLTVILDLDDTLVDFATARRDGLRDHLSAPAPWLTGDGFTEVLGTWRRIEQVHVDQYLRGRTGFREQRRARIRDFCRAYHLAPVSSDRAADDWFAGFEASCEARLAPFPEVAHALAALAQRGVPLGVLSNNRHEVQERKLRRTGLRDRFATLLCVDDLGGAAKPDPRTFRAACAALRGEPATAVYVGDDLDTDARGAVRAGLIGVWLDRAGRPRPGDVPTVSSLTGLVGWLEDAGLLMPARQLER